MNEVKNINTSNQLNICMDIGNTNIVIGVFTKHKLIEKFRLSTNVLMTSDEYGIKIIQLFDFYKINKEDISGFIISSVVPELDMIIKLMVNKYFNIEPLVVGPKVKTGINIKLDNPKQLGADLLVGAVGACEKYGPNCLVIDIGTALTMVYINEKKEFLGGAIMPGIRTAFSTLAQKTSKLEDVAIEDVKEVLGRDTKTSLQSGMIFGWASLVEGMIIKYKKAYGIDHVVITGGEARFIIKHIDKDLNVIYDDDLLLDGLNIIYSKNTK